MYLPSAALGGSPTGEEAQNPGKSCIQKPIFGPIFQPDLVPPSGTKFGSENGTNGGAYSENEGFGLAVFPFLEPNLVPKTGTRGSTKSSPREGKKSTAKVGRLAARSHPFRDQHFQTSSTFFNDLIHIHSS